MAGLTTRELALIVVNVLWIIVALKGWSTRYDEGVWDGTYNPTIPPVKRALERLSKRGWKP